MGIISFRFRSIDELKINVVFARYATLTFFIGGSLAMLGCIFKPDLRLAMLALVFYIFMLFFYVNDRFITLRMEIRKRGP